MSAAEPARLLGQRRRAYWAAVGVELWGGECCRICNTRRERPRSAGFDCDPEWRGSCDMDSEAGSWNRNQHRVDIAIGVTRR